MGGQQLQGHALGLLLQRLRERLQRWGDEGVKA